MGGVCVCVCGVWSLYMCGHKNGKTSKHTTNNIYYLISGNSTNRSKEDTAYSKVRHDLEFLGQYFKLFFRRVAYLHRPSLLHTS